MSSIGEDVTIVGRMLRDNGFYPGDSQAFQLSSYENDWGGTTHHVAYTEAEVVRLLTSPACHDIKPLWTRHSGITEEGMTVQQKFFDKVQK